jgi:hypothetical protein
VRARVPGGNGEADVSGSARVATERPAGACCLRRDGSGPGRPDPPWRLAAAYTSARLTCLNPGGMVTMALAMLAFVGCSHCTLVTPEERLVPAAPP